MWYFRFYGLNEGTMRILDGGINSIDGKDIEFNPGAAYTPRSQPLNLIHENRD